MHAISRTWRGARLAERRCMRIGLAILVCGVVSGCGFYFDDDRCEDRAYQGAPQSFFNPLTGQCVADSSGCDDSCGPCAEATAAPESEPWGGDMGLCYSSCTDLSEYACHATPECYAAYTTDLKASDDELTFDECKQIAPSGPSTGACTGLDAWSCSRHDDCSLVHEVTSTGKRFAACIDEPYQGVCADTDCAPGYHCEDQCTTGGDSMNECTAVCVANVTCALLDCAPGYACAEVCADGGPGVSTCKAECVPTSTEPGSCTGAVSCFTNAPACPSGTTPGIRDGCWTGYCIPNAACGPSDPGVCYAPVTCDAPGPACPSGTTPGIVDGCYTGYCIPVSQCAATSCATVTSESACTARTDCEAVYTGMGCECTLTGCTCETLTYDHCESL